jgi:hypothetical protein
MRLEVKGISANHADTYFQGDRPMTEKSKKCKNCGKEIESGLYCSACFQGETEGSRNLNEIYEYLDLNEAKDGRLNIKAEIMKKVIRLTSKWGSGSKNEWINLLANRTCVSTRKIREDYIQPLISEKILLETQQGFIQFAGLPSNRNRRFSNEG